jgi:hypothetical protein
MPAPRSRGARQQTSWELHGLLHWVGDIYNTKEEALTAMEKMQYAEGEIIELSHGWFAPQRAAAQLVSCATVELDDQGVSVRNSNGDLESDANCEMVVHVINGRAVPCLIQLRDIMPGDELMYVYRHGSDEAEEVMESEQIKWSTKTRERRHGEAEKEEEKKRKRLKTHEAGGPRDRSGRFALNPSRRNSQGQYGPLQPESDS